MPGGSGIRCHLAACRKRGLHATWTRVRGVSGSFYGRVFWRGADGAQGDSNGRNDRPQAEVQAAIAAYARARQAKGKWSQGTTHFIIRIDALGRQFQNEFTQTMTDAAIWSPAEWDVKKLQNYNGIGDDPATAGYQVPVDLPGGKQVPVNLVVIPKILWNAFGDPDPIQWINDRIKNPNLEIGQHGTYHNNLTPYGDWASDPTLNYYSSEMSGFTVPEMFQYLRIGKRTLLGDYLSDPWIQQSGATAASARIDWTQAANPLISFAPPFNASDANAREAVARLGYPSFTASIYEENSTKFTPEGSHHEQFDQFGMFHASADLQVDPEDVASLSSITQWGHLNTWLIEEVEWSTRYCNDTPRLDPCASAPGGINRENNMVDLTRWNLWMTLLDFVKNNGVPMTEGDYTLAISFDNAPTVSNPTQDDSDHDGIGDVIDGATLVADDVTAVGASATLRAVLTAQAGPIAGQLVTFTADTNGDGPDETFTATTSAAGVATAAITVSRPTSFGYAAEWNGKLVTASDTATVTIPAPPHVAAVTPPLVTVQNKSQALNTVTITFDKDVQITAADVTVLGLVGGARNDFAFAYNAATFTVTLTWATPLGNDTYKLTVKDTVTADGLALDGEQANPLAPTLPSGNGTAGGDFVGVIYRLAADITRDRKVNVFDLQRMSLSWNKTTGQTGYDAACDLTGDGKVNVFDLQIMSANWNKQIPAGP